jgi:hypothetical protein
MSKAIKVSATKKGPVKRKAHVRKIKTAADAPGAGGEMAKMKAAKPAGKVKMVGGAAKVKGYKKFGGFPSANHQRMAAVRAARKK